MKFTRHELMFIRNTLLAKKAYKDSEIPFNEVIWEPWMGSLLDRVNRTLRTTPHYDDHEILT